MVFLSSLFMIACRRVGAGSSDTLAACSITKKQVERERVALSNLRKVAQINKLGISGQMIAQNSKWQS